MSATPSSGTGASEGTPFTGDPAWRTSHVLRDGTRITVRPIFPEDAEALRQGFLQISPETRYLRFLGIMGELTPEQLRYFTDVDQKDHVAIVATILSDDLKEERGVGVARFIRLKGEPDVAEAAVTVTDAMQRKGVGTVLVRELERAAVAHGIKRIRAEVLAGNDTMRAILDSAGARAHARDAEGGMIAYDIDLEPDVEKGLSPRLLAILRGAAQTLALTIRRLIPPEAPPATEPAAAPEGAPPSSGA